MPSIQSWHRDWSLMDIAAIINRYIQLGEDDSTAAVPFGPTCGSPLGAVSTSTSVPHASRSTPTSKASGLGGERCFFPGGTFGPPAWQASVRLTLENLIEPASRVAKETSPPAAW